MNFRFHMELNLSQEIRKITCGESFCKVIQCRPPIKEKTSEKHYVMFSQRGFRIFSHRASLFGSKCSQPKILRKTQAEFYFVTIRALDCFYEHAVCSHDSTDIKNSFIAKMSLVYVFPL